MTENEYNETPEGKAAYAATLARYAVACRDRARGEQGGARGFYQRRRKRAEEAVRGIADYLIDYRNDAPEKGAIIQESNA